MHRLSALLACWLLCAGNLTAAENSCRNNPTDIHHTHPGVVLTTGIESFQVDHPAPELLEKIGALLCAAGTEELRVAGVADRSGYGDPAKQAWRNIRLVEFIGGREVLMSWVSINLNIETHEVMELRASFLPDRDVDRAPKLTAAEALAKVEAGMRKDPYVEAGSDGRVKMSFYDSPTHLAYDIEQFGFSPPRGVLVWIFGARGIDNDQQYQVSIDADTGKVIAARGMLLH